MAWRTISIGDRKWTVAVAVERRANTASWALMLAFRPQGAPGRTVWAECPMQSSSRAVLYEQAERISDSSLIGLLEEHLAGLPA
jgi:hypothetical protein